VTNPDIQAYCRAKNFHRQTEARWLALPAADGEALLRLARELKAGENHLKDILDWLEEIALGDGGAIAEILTRQEFARIASDPRLGRNDKLKRLKEELRRLRFPRLARIEEEIRRHIRDMKLDPLLSVSVPPGLEGGAVTVNIRAAACDDLKRVAAQLVRATETDAMKEIFSLLRGETAEEDRATK
jgi:hypothetical protein